MRSAAYSIPTVILSPACYPPTFASLTRDAPALADLFLFNGCGTRLFAVWYLTGGSCRLMWWWRSEHLLACGLDPAAIHLHLLPRYRPFLTPPPPTPPAFPTYHAPPPAPAPPPTYTPGRTHHLHCLAVLVTRAGCAHPPHYPHHTEHRTRRAGPILPHGLRARRTTTYRPTHAWPRLRDLVEARKEKKRKKERKE